MTQLVRIVARALFVPNGQEIINRYFYVKQGAIPVDFDDVVEMAVEFADTVQTAYRALASEQVLFVSVTVWNDETDFFGVSSFPLPSLGLFPDQSLPSFTVGLFRINRSTGLTRSGYKVITGIPENQVAQNGAPENPIYAALIQDYVDAVGATLIMPNGTVFIPVIASGYDSTNGTAVGLNGTVGATYVGLTYRKTRKGANFA